MGWRHYQKNVEDFCQCATIDRIIEVFPHANRFIVDKIFNDIRHSLHQEQWSFGENSGNAILLSSVNAQESTNSESDACNRRDVEQKEIRKRKKELTDLSNPTPGT